MVPSAAVAARAGNVTTLRASGQEFTLKMGMALSTEITALRIATVISAAGAARPNNEYDSAV